MDDGEASMKMKCTKAGSRAPSRDDPNSTYTELNIREVDRLTNTQADGLDPTYSHLNCRQNELLVAKDENHPIASGPGGMPETAKAGPHKQEPNENIGNRPYRLICLLCLVTFSLVVIVAGLSIYVSQIRQSNITSDQSCHELNSTLPSKLSALNSNLSDLKRMHSDLRHQLTEMETKYRSVNETKAQICELLTNRRVSQIHHQLTEMETKYRSVNETKAQICELLTSRREQTCSMDWVTKKDRCYYVSTFEATLYKAIQECSNRDSRLLEINSSDEASFVTRKLVKRNGLYWIGKCEYRNVSFPLLHKGSSETSVCHQCDPTAVTRRYPCDRDWRFICEKPAPLIPDIPETIQGLC